MAAMGAAGGAGYDYCTDAWQVRRATRLIVRIRSEKRLVPFGLCQATVPQGVAVRQRQTAIVAMQRACVGSLN
jgi:hypothetical protein